MPAGNRADAAPRIHSAVRIEAGEKKTGTCRIREAPQRLALAAMRKTRLDHVLADGGKGAVFLPRVPILLCPQRAVISARKRGGLRVVDGEDPNYRQGICRKRTPVDEVCGGLNNVRR